MFNDRHALALRLLWLAALVVVLLGLFHALEHGLDTPEATHVCTVCAHGPGGAAPSPGGTLAAVVSAWRPVSYSTWPDRAIQALPAAFLSRGPPNSFIA